ncbi:hypothetical protein [Pseudohalioglobus lutimaris]|uniref:Uncharacterized protein n=1 Tax=Pseudohalioglobus lutimaris TaxID=1737061 RepID=A0A2N5X0X1_9GAMM|nr:hypothetical protein [Pseudohalioglobus lutimaris]PLW68145.1 hypothetical protein C0039_13190 [Pseudohalioglobus lutimaris]
MLNRDLLIVRLKQPFVDWINEADPYPDRIPTSLANANEDCPVFLIHQFACEDLEGWLKHCYAEVFEEVLYQWYVDESLWPQDRNLKMFKAWCEVEVHGVITDLVDEPLLDSDWECSEFCVTVIPR